MAHGLVLKLEEMLQRNLTSKKDNFEPIIDEDKVLQPWISASKQSFFKLDFYLLLRKTLFYLFSHQSLKEHQKSELLGAVTLYFNAHSSMLKNNLDFRKPLIDIILDPWKNFFFSWDEFFQQKITVYDRKVQQYFATEPEEIVTARIHAFVGRGKDEMAMVLAKGSYMYHSRISKNLFITDSYGHCVKPKTVILGTKYMKGTASMDWYLFILQRKKSLPAIISEIKQLTCHEGVQLVQRLRRSKRNQNFIFTLLQILVVQELIKPSKFCCTKKIFTLWCFMHKEKKSGAIEINQAIRKMLAMYAPSSAHFYLFADALWEQLGPNLIPLYVELYVRGLTVDINHLEAVRYREDMEETNYLENHIAGIFSKLSTLFSDFHEGAARECMFSAFSLKPTTERLYILQSLTHSILSAENEIKMNINAGMVSQECKCDVRCHGFCKDSKDYCLEHPVLKKGIPNVPYLLVKDLVTVLEGVRCFQFQYNVFDWHKNATDLGDYHEHFTLQKSWDSETEYASEGSNRSDLEDSSEKMSYSLDQVKISQPSLKRKSLSNDRELLLLHSKTESPVENLGKRLKVSEQNVGGDKKYDLLSKPFSCNFAPSFRTEDAIENVIRMTLDNKKEPDSLLKSNIASASFSHTANEVKNSVSRDDNNKVSSANVKCKVPGNDLHSYTTMSLDQRNNLNLVGSTSVKSMPERRNEYSSSNPSKSLDIYQSTLTHVDRESVISPVINNKINASLENEIIRHMKRNIPSKALHDFHYSQVKLNTNNIPAIQKRSNNTDEKYSNHQNMLGNLENKSVYQQSSAYSGKQQVSLINKAVSMKSSSPRLTSSTSNFTKTQIMPNPSISSQQAIGSIVTQSQSNFSIHHSVYTSTSCSTHELPTYKSASFPHVSQQAINSSLEDLNQIRSDDQGHCDRSSVIQHTMHHITENSAQVRNEVLAPNKINVSKNISATKHNASTSGIFNLPSSAANSLINSGSISTSLVSPSMSQTVLAHSNSSNNNTPSSPDSETLSSQSVIVTPWEAQRNRHGDLVYKKSSNTYLSPVEKRIYKNRCASSHVVKPSAKLIRQTIAVDKSVNPKLFKAIASGQVTPRFLKLPSKQKQTSNSYKKVYFQVPQTPQINSSQPWYAEPYPKPPVCDNAKATKKSIVYNKPLVMQQSHSTTKLINKESVATYQNPRHAPVSTVTTTHSSSLMCSTSLPSSSSNYLSRSTLSQLLNTSQSSSKQNLNACHSKALNSSGNSPSPNTSANMPLSSSASCTSLSFPSPASTPVLSSSSHASYPTYSSPSLVNTAQSLPHLNATLSSTSTVVSTSQLSSSGALNLKCSSPSSTLNAVNFSNAHLSSFQTAVSNSNSCYVSSPSPSVQSSSSSITSHSSYASPQQVHNVKSYPTASTGNVQSLLKKIKLVNSAASSPREHPFETTKSCSGTSVKTSLELPNQYGNRVQIQSRSVEEKVPVVFTSSTEANNHYVPIPPGSLPRVCCSPSEINPCQSCSLPPVEDIPSQSSCQKDVHCIPEQPTQKTTECIPGQSNPNSKNVPINVFLAPTYCNVNELKDNCETKAMLSSIVTCQHCFQLFSATDLEMHILNAHSKDASLAPCNTTFNLNSRQTENICTVMKSLPDVVPEQDTLLLRESLQSDLPSNKSFMSILDNPQSVNETVKNAVELDTNAFDACLDLINNDKNFDKIFQGINSFEQNENYLPFMMPTDPQNFLNPHLCGEIPKTGISVLQSQDSGTKTKNDTYSAQYENPHFRGENINQLEKPTCSSIEFTNTNPNMLEMKLNCAKPERVCTEKMTSEKSEVTFTELAEMIKASLVESGNTEIETLEANSKSLKINNYSKATCDFDVNHNGIVEGDSNVITDLKKGVGSGCSVDLNQKGVYENSSAVDQNHTSIKTIHNTDPTAPQKIKLKCGHCNKILGTYQSLKKHTLKLHGNIVPTYTKVLVLDKRIRACSSPAGVTQSMSISNTEKTDSMPFIQINMKKDIEETNTLPNRSVLKGKKKGMCKVQKTQCQICGKNLTVPYMKTHMKKKHAELQSMHGLKNEESNISTDSKVENLCSTSVDSQTFAAVATVQEQDIDSSTCLSVSDALKRNNSFIIADASNISTESGKLVEDNNIKFNFNNVDFSKSSHVKVENSTGNQTSIQRSSELASKNFNKRKKSVTDPQIKSLRKNSSKSGYFPCSICNKVLSSKGNLTRHLKQVHKIDIPSGKIKQEKYSASTTIKTNKESIVPVQISNEALPCNSKLSEKLVTNLRNKSSGISKKAFTNTNGNLLKTVLYSNFMSKQLQTRESTVTKITNSQEIKVNNTSSCDTFKCDYQPNLYNCIDLQDDKQTPMNKLQSGVISCDLPQSSGVFKLEAGGNATTVHDATLNDAYNISEQKESSNQVDMPLNSARLHVSDSKFQAEYENSNVVLSNEISPISDIIYNVSKCQFGGASNEEVKRKNIDDNSLKLSIPSHEKPLLISESDGFPSQTYGSGVINVSSASIMKNIDESPETLNVFSKECLKRSPPKLNSFNFDETNKNVKDFPDKAHESISAKLSVDPNICDMSYISHSGYSAAVNVKNRSLKDAPKENVGFKSIKNFIDDTVEQILNRPNCTGENISVKVRKTSTSDESIKTSIENLKDIESKMDGITKTEISLSNYIENQISQSNVISENEISVSKDIVNEILQDISENDILSSCGTEDISMPNISQNNKISGSCYIFENEINMSNIAECKVSVKDVTETQINASNVTKTEITLSNTATNHVIENKNNKSSDTSKNQIICPEGAINGIDKVGGMTENFEVVCDNNFERNLQDISLKVESTSFSGNVACQPNNSTKIFENKDTTDGVTNTSEDSVCEKSDNLETNCIKCKLCHQDFITRNALSMHLKNVHDIPVLKTHLLRNPETEAFGCTKLSTKLSPPVLRLEVNDCLNSDCVTNYVSIDSSLKSSDCASVEMQKGNLKEYCVSLMTELQLQTNSLDSSLETKLKSESTETEMKLSGSNSFDFDLNKSENLKKPMAFSSKYKFRRHSFCDIRSLIQVKNNEHFSASDIDVPHINLKHKYETLKVKSVSLPNFQVALKFTTSLKENKMNKSKIIDFNDEKLHPLVEFQGAVERSSLENSHFSNTSEDKSSDDLSSDHSSIQRCAVSHISDFLLPEPRSNSSSLQTQNNKIKIAQRKFIYQKIQSYKKQKNTRKRVKTNCFCCSKNKPIKQVNKTECFSCKRKRGRPRKLSNLAVHSLKKAAEISEFLKTHRQPIVRLIRLKDSYVKKIKETPTIPYKFPIKNAVVKLERLHIASEVGDLSFPNQTFVPSILPEQLAFDSLSMQIPKKNGYFTNIACHLRSDSPEVIHTGTVSMKPPPEIIDLTDSNSINSNTLPLDSQDDETFDCTVKTEGYSELLAKKCFVVLKKVGE